jgi:hypothetical protein
VLVIAKPHGENGPPPACPGAGADAGGGVAGAGTTRGDAGATGALASGVAGTLRAGARNTGGADATGTVRLARGLIASAPR